MSLSLYFIICFPRASNSFVYRLCSSSEIFSSVTLPPLVFSIQRCAAITFFSLSTSPFISVFIFQIVLRALKSALLFIQSYFVLLLFKSKFKLIFSFLTGLIAHASSSRPLLVQVFSLQIPITIFIFEFLISFRSVSVSLALCATLIF